MPSKKKDVKKNGEDKRKENRRKNRHIVDTKL